MSISPSSKPRALSRKDVLARLQVYTDVALDPYNCDGHDGIVRDDGVILNDETVEYLCRQAVSQVIALASSQEQLQVYCDVGHWVLPLASVRWDMRVLIGNPSSS